MNLKFLRRLPIAPVALLFVFLVYGAGAFWFAQTGGVWSPDCGARLIQVESVAARGLAGLAIMQGEQQQDTEQFAFHPLAFFAYPHNGDVYVFYSFLFALIVAPLYKWLGFFGLALPAIMGGTASVGLTYLLAKRMRLRSPIAPMLLTAFATPLAIYSLVFWDHALLCAIALLALFLLLDGIQRSKPPLLLACGAVIGGGVWFHEILLPFVPAFLVALLLFLPRRAFLPNAALLLVGLFALLLPLGFVNNALYGTPFGPHLANNHLATSSGILRFLATPQEWTAGALYTLFGWGDANPAFTSQLRAWLENPNPKFAQEIAASKWMAAPLILWMILTVTGRAAHRRVWPFALLSLLSLLGAVGWVLTHEDFPHGPFVACPLLAIAFAAVPGLFRRTVPTADAEEKNALRNRRVVAVVALIYTLANLLKPTLGGTEWGSRHLLAVVPMFVLLAWCAVEDWAANVRANDTELALPSRLFLSTTTMLAVASFLIVAHGLRVIRPMHERSRALANAIVATEDDLILTSVWWAMATAPQSHARKRILLADEESEARALIAYLQAAPNLPPTITLLEYPAESLAYYVRALGYVPISGTRRDLPMNLVARRYLRIAPESPTASR